MNILLVLVSLYICSLYSDLCDDRPLDSSKHPQLFEFDHIFADSRASGLVAILYGALGTECFREFHVALVDASKQVQNCEPFVATSSTIS